MVLNEKIRNYFPWIDNAKTIGIFFVVAGHLFFPTNIINFIYSFHMPLFFILSGFTFNKTDSFTSFIIKKIKTILVPYFCFAIITYLFWLLLGRKFGEDSIIELSVIKPLLGILYSNGGNNWLIFNISLWFLTCLFVVEMIYFFLKDLSPLLLLIILGTMTTTGLILSRIDFLRLPWSINTAIVAISFFAYGSFIKLLINHLIVKLSNRLWLGLISFSLFFVTFHLSNVNTRVDMNSNHYGSFFFFFLNSLLGSSATILLALSIPKNRISTFIGRNTIIILALHNIGFSFLKAIQVFVIQIPLETLNNAVLINILYTFTCILILIPICFFVNRYIPWIIGRTKKLV